MSTHCRTCSFADEMYGGRPASDVRSDGARSNTVLSMADGVVGRGVLLDIPRALGCEFLDGNEVVTVADLEAAEAAQHVRVGEGDVLLVAWGRESRRAAKKGFDGFSGLHAECLPWLHERENLAARKRRDLRPDAVRGYS